MTKQEYGEKYDEHLLEQYKLYVEMTDQVSTRRAHTNRFYVSLLSGLLALFSWAVCECGLVDAPNVVFLAVAIF